MRGYYLSKYAMTVQAISSLICQRHISSKWRLKLSYFWRVKTRVPTVTDHDEI